MGYVTYVLLYGSPIRLEVYRQSPVVYRKHGGITPFPIPFFWVFRHIVVLHFSAMEPSSDSDDEYFTVQLDGSDGSPRVQKVISSPLRLDSGIDDCIPTRQFSVRRSR